MTPDLIRQRHELTAGHLNERQRRLWTGTEARVLGWGGIGQVSRVTGPSRGVVAAGCRELVQPERAARGARVRRPGGGHKRPTARSDAEGGFGAVGGAGQSERAGLAIALDLQEHPPPDGDAAPTGPCGQPHGGGGTAPWAGL